jgi:DNA-binding CsgD family transcriptional regulator
MANAQNPQAGRASAGGAERAAAQNPQAGRYAAGADAAKGRSATAERGQSTFVGRDPELQSLRSLLGRARGGSGGIALICGEAGIGKSRLAREFARDAEAAGALVAWGRCYEGPWAPPLSPWGEIVSDLLPDVATADPDVSMVANILPDRASHSVSPHPVHLIGDDERARVLDATARIILNATTRGPVVAVIDDFQWADPVSVDMLRHLAYFVPRRAVVVLVLERTGDSARSPHVADANAWLRIDADALALTLEGLPAQAISAMLGADSPKSRRIANALAARTAGNPFFIEELVRQRAAEGFTDPVGSLEAAVPENIRLVVGRRVQQLSERAQTLLHRAALFANGFDLPVLQQMVELRENDLLDGLDEALAANLLQPVRGHPERYDFVHTIVRHCLSATWNPSRRVRIHRQAAEAIETVYQGRITDADAEIAFQYHCSASLPGAINGLPHALRVVQECRVQCTPEHAVTFLRIARDLSREGSPADQASVIGQLSSAEAEIGHVDEALEALREYLALAKRAKLAPVEIAERLDIVARSLKYSAYAEERCWRPIVERGLRLVTPADGRIWARLRLMIDPVEPLSRSGIRIGRWLGFDPTAVAILQSSGDEDDAARSMESFDPVSRVETDAYLTRVRGWSEPTAVMYGLTVAANHYQYRHGAYRDARRLWQELAEMSAAASAIHWQQQATNQLTYIQIAEGAFADALESEHAANELGARLGTGQNQPAHLLEMTTCRAIYQGGDWRDLSLRWCDLLDDPTYGPHDLATLSGALYAGLAAYCAAQADEHDEARRILGMLTPVIRRMRPADCNHNGAVAFAAGAVWRINAADLAPVYRSLAVELIEAGAGDYPQTSLRLAQGQMAALMDRKAEAISCFSEARATVSLSGQRPLLPVIDLAEAEALLRWDDPEAYRRLCELATAARPRFTEFAMTPWLQDLQLLVEAADARFLRKQHLPGNITEREAGVLRLIARGFSDRQISDELFVSPRTINAHVRNMLAKTEAANRVELAMWARDNGIVEV